MSRMGPQPGEKVGPKRTKEQRTLDTHEMVKLLRRGWRKGDIARKLEVTPAQITYDWKKVLKDIRQETFEETWAEIVLKLEEYGEIKREAWDAWERSKKPGIKEVEEDKVGDDGKCITTISRTTTCRVGDKGYLLVVMDCLQAERELLALDPPKSLKVQANVINWDVLAGELPRGEVPDEIEAEIQKAMLVHNQALDEIGDRVIEELEPKK